MMRKNTSALVTAHIDSMYIAREYTYWDRPEAIALFSPLAGEFVSQCVIRREEILFQASCDDDALAHSTDGIDKIDELCNHQRHTLRVKCIFVRKAYEVALQYMNAYT